MATHRDEVRASRQEVFRKLDSLGGNLDAERRRGTANQRLLAHGALKLINDGTSRTNNQQLVRDDPPGGAFNGVNVTFALSEPVAGLNIEVIWGDTTNNITIPLERTTVNPPGSHEFFYDPANPTEIIVGNPPAPADRLIAIFKRIG